VVAGVVAYLEGGETKMSKIVAPPAEQFKWWYTGAAAPNWGARLRLWENGVEGWGASLKLWRKDGRVSLS
jgi:hypothetical protein